MVDQTPYSNLLLDQVVPPKEQVVEASSTTPPIRIQVVGQAIELGKTKLNTIVKELGHVTMDFFALPMYEVHVIQKAKM